MDLCIDWSAEILCTVKPEGSVDGENSIVAADVAQRAIGVAGQDPTTVAAQELDASLRNGCGSHGIRLDDADDIVVEGPERRCAG